MIVVIISACNIYLFIRQIPNPSTAASARINDKEREKKERSVRRAKKRKGFEVYRMKAPTPSRAFDAFITNEEQNGKEIKEQTGSGSPAQLSWTLWSAFTTRMDQTITLL